MNEKKEIQNAILSIFKEIIKICERHNLRYYAIGGTCIGAVRHKGFIPWDDDLDIAMPDSDYKKFYEYAQKELPPELKVFYTADMRHNGNVFMKVHNTSTTFIEKSELNHPDSYKGVYVDIMPLGGVPSDSKLQKKYAFRVKYMIWINQKRRCSFGDHNALKSKLLWLVFLPLNIFVPYDFWSKKWQKYTEKFSFDKSDYTGYVWSRNIGRLIFDKVWFEDYVEMPFEDTTIRCPSGWDKYLSQHFGDYMKLPPESARLIHDNGGIVDLDKSYSYYQSKKQEEIK